MRYRYFLILSVLILPLGLAACSVSPQHIASAALSPQETLQSPTLGISDETLLPGVDVLSVNDDMRRFLAEHVPEEASRERKVELILQAILRDGLQLDYSAFKTHTAEQAFYQREGNCLSFTNLFVALARESGLKVEYQEVDVPPSWERLGDNHLFNRHINARVILPFQGEQAVDFNMADFEVEYKRKRVSDDYARALYYNNMGVYWLGEKQLDQAYLNFREAILLQPETAFFWTNLGTLHRRTGDDLRAETAWLEAVRLADEPSAMSNLARLYARQGKHQLAVQYAETIEGYRRKNPYYLHNQAEQAYSRDEYSEAISLLRRAIKIRSDEHDFYRLLGLSQLRIGNNDAALRSFELAEETAKSEADRRRYSHKQHLMAQISP
jgi:Flp pilus assembly protein TadD